MVFRMIIILNLKNHSDIQLHYIYTEVILFSDKDIYLKYAENCNFEQEKMKDITDTNKQKFALFTVLLGLSLLIYSSILKNFFLKSFLIYKKIVFFMLWNKSICP